ncbi:unnamed protein product [Microthlaspi erraticum]|uniref:Uncharacterized protein n=1 Tax=Microthlaspi erraticum TaxID=1685480 RepID=A0A6D2HIR8_9BRAS|nr:unnamed protein product [Microthlaspi erraticum]
MGFPKFNLMIATKTYDDGKILRRRTHRLRTKYGWLAFVHYLWEIPVADPIEAPVVADPAHVADPIEALVVADPIEAPVVADPAHVADTIEAPVAADIVEEAAPIAAAIANAQEAPHVPVPIKGYEGNEVFYKKCELKEINLLLRERDLPIAAAIANSQEAAPHDINHQQKCELKEISLLLREREKQDAPIEAPVVADIVAADIVEEEAAPHVPVPRYERFVH